MRTPAVLLVFGLCAGFSWSQFLNNKPWPTYSLENMPDTEFSCRDKILGGYYADPQTQCQMFHICVKVAGVGIQDFRFLCPNGTAFDQDHQICADWEDVDCDATTLYYSSDNFDLYRIGSGFESKAVKYGEDEEFSLQRADTGDARLNREHQTQRVNQQFETNNNYNRKNNNNYNHNNNNHNNNNNNNNNKHRSQQQDDDREIFRGSSSSNFFNNRNNGKENEDDYDDTNVNINQDRDEIHRKKVVKTQHRRPNYRTTEAPRTREPITEAPEQPRQTTTIQPVRRNKSQIIQQRNNNYEQDYEAQTIKPQRPAGFTNNFAGSFPSTTSRPTSTTLTNEQYTKAVNNYRSRNQRVRVQNDRQYNNAENFRQNQNANQEAHSQTPVYTVSTPAPFRQTQYKTKSANFNQYNNPTTTTTTTTTTRPIVESYTTLAPKNPSSFSTKNYNQKSSTSSKQTTPFKQTENYPINNPKYNNNFEKKQPLAAKNENYPTTYAPKTKYNKNKDQENYPTTFAPKVNSAYSQTQTTQHKNSQNTQYFNPPVPSQARQNNHENFNKDPTPKTSPFTRYTPTVPKLSSTTPTSRSQSGLSARYDETEYDDGSYDTKYDNKEDLNTAHSQNIAASRNEFLKNTKPPQQRTTQKQVQQTKSTPAAAVTKKQNPQKATQPRPFSPSSNTPKVTERPKQVATSTTKNLPERPRENKKQEAPKTKKDYDYAYYDSNNEHEYDLQYHTELKKSTANN